MTNTVHSLVLAATMAGGLVAIPAAAGASERDKTFFSSVQGQWSGPGEIVAGKYKGTKFTCNFTGGVPDGKIGMSLDGGCRVGFFTQRMNANIEHAGREGYRGTFMDGAKGTGLDVVSGSVERDKGVFAITRNALNGTMQARLPDTDTMHVTVSVRVDDQMVPVIGMNLKRLDTRSVGAVTERP